MYSIAVSKDQQHETDDRCFPEGRVAVCAQNGADVAVAVRRTKGTSAGVFHGLKQSDTSEPLVDLRM